MRIELLAFYGGPDQVMTVTSGLASVLGLLLLFWNKVVGLFFKILKIQFFFSKKTLLIYSNIFFFFSIFFHFSIKKKIKCKKCIQVRLTRI